MSVVSPSRVPTRSLLAAVVLLALAALADLATTFFGLHIGLVETNPVAASALSTSTPVLSFLLMKLVAGLVAVVPLLGSGYRRLRFLAPLVVALVWFGAAVWNAYLAAGVIAS